MNYIVSELVTNGTTKASIKYNGSDLNQARKAYYTSLVKGCDTAAECFAVILLSQDGNIIASMKFGGAE